ncbi:MAG: metallophosphoesterase [Thermogutta sp.]
MNYISFLLLCLMCLGHVTIWAAIWNRLHGFGLSYGICSRMTAILVALGATIPTVLVALIMQREVPLFELPSVGRYATAHRGWTAMALLADAYVVACWMALPYSVLWRIWRRSKPQPPVYHFTKKELAFGAKKPFRDAILMTTKVTLRRLSRPRRWLVSGLRGSSKAWIQSLRDNSGHGLQTKTRVKTLFPRSESSEQPLRSNHNRDSLVSARREKRRRSPGYKNKGEGPIRYGKKQHFLLHLPGNESLMCERVDVGIRVPRLSRHLEGMTIIQLSDLHFTGKIGLDYYDQIVEHTNSLRPDLIVVTGDIVDRAECVDDAATVLSGLQARHGVFFVLGNHDLRADASVVRSALSAAGLTDVGGRVVHLPLDGTSFLIGGNELPWLGPAPDFAQASNGDGRTPLRLLLAHTPDQFAWAVRHQVDLMLAGHTHGGQICLPGLGPIIAPSARGVRYAHGLHYRQPTAMYVTRGLAGEFPVRYFCSPELTRIILFPAGDTGREL